jgi:hypothetical protein
VIYFCCDDRRRALVRNRTTLNGIDFVEVVDNPSDPPDARQRVLLVHLIRPLGATVIGVGNVRIEGGDRIRNIAVARVTVPGSSPPISPPDTSVLEVEVSAAGDFSMYTLRLMRSSDAPEQPPFNFDPALSAVEFSFKAACPNEFDCRLQSDCQPASAKPLEINYLTKDFAGFRQLMLDRIAVLIPEWEERSEADLGIVLLELLAYVGDYLSYQQDAVATEAYLNTARRRTSVRRHARLVDYSMHDGSNARTWVHFELPWGSPPVLLQNASGRPPTQLLTHVEELARIIPFGSADYDRALNANPVIFELMEDAELRFEHNRIPFHTWGARECCLPRGATRATLRGAFPLLRSGMTLVFVEVRGPKTGVEKDADPTHRCAVRLTEVSLSEDPVGDESASPPAAVPVTEIRWARADALPFPVCVSARNGTNVIDGVSVAFGNIVLADHGRTIPTEAVQPLVPQPNPALAVAAAYGNRCSQTPPPSPAVRYRPSLARLPVTQAAPTDASSASSTGIADSRKALPEIELTDAATGDRWIPVRDLLASGEKREFVLEVEDDTAYLRFGDGQFGLQPPAGTQFMATYRIGNGAEGNIGADALYHIATDDPALLTILDPPVISSAGNPLPAAGGTDPEAIEQVRRYAPSAFRVQERAVTADDYAAMARRCDPDLQNAAATFRWTGSWRTVFVTVDRKNAEEVTPAYAAGLRQCLERYRMAGQDLEIDAPRYVSLEIEMTICVKRGYFPEDVEAAALRVLSSGFLADGSRGVFHPDNFSFGQPVFLSPVYAAVQVIEGVASVEITKFQRQGQDSRTALDAARLDLDRLEIARLENSADFPDRSVLRIHTLGGR